MHRFQKSSRSTIRNFWPQAVTGKPHSPLKSLGINMSDAEFDPSHYRDNPQAIARYLTEAFETNDLSTIMQCINRVMRAQNVQALAREAGLRRDRLYKTFGGEVSVPARSVIARPSPIKRSRQQQLQFIWSKWSLRPV